MYKQPTELKKVYLPKITKYLKYRQNAKVLDLGCGPGYFLELLDKLGCETYGVDINENIIARARRRTKAKLYVHDINQGLPMFPENFFDVVVMLDIIEHLSSPYHTLKEIHRILKKNGILFITTPNINALGRLLLKIARRESQWFGYVDPTHIYLFSPASLKHIVEKSSFKVLELETLFKPLPKFSKVIGRVGLGGQIILIASALKKF